MVFDDEHSLKIVPQFRVPVWLITSSLHLDDAEGLKARAHESLPNDIEGVAETDTVTALDQL